MPPHFPSVLRHAKYVPPGEIAVVSRLSGGLLWRFGAPRHSRDCRIKKATLSEAGQASVDWPREFFTGTAGLYLLKQQEASGVN
jgi:hypothetical protein